MAKIHVDDLVKKLSEESYAENSLEFSRSSKHDLYVEKLNSEIRNLYDVTIPHYTIFSKSKKTKKLVTKGEIDLLCVKGKTIHAYEVKCSNRITKAKHQLKKLKKNLFSQFSDIKEVKMFFYCGSSDILTSIFV